MVAWQLEGHCRARGKALHPTTARTHTHTKAKQSDFTAGAVNGCSGNEVITSTITSTSAAETIKVGESTVL